MNDFATDLLAWQINLVQFLFLEETRNIFQMEAYSQIFLRNLSYYLDSSQVSLGMRGWYSFLSQKVLIKSSAFHFLQYIDLIYISMMVSRDPLNQLQPSSGTWSQRAQVEGPSAPGSCTDSHGMFLLAPRNHHGRAPSSSTRE